MTLRLLALILVSVALSAMAQLLLKLGVMQALGGARTTIGAMSVIDRLWLLITSPMVIFGLCLYGFGTIVWLFVLAKAPLSVAYPFVGLGFIFTAILGAMVLGENVTPLRLAGVALIALGCAAVAHSA